MEWSCRGMEGLGIRKTIEIEVESLGKKLMMFMLVNQRTVNKVVDKRLKKANRKSQVTNEKPKSKYMYVRNTKL